MHIPVLQTEVLALLAPKDVDVIIDATLGLGGHTQSFLDNNKSVHVHGVDTDDENLVLAKKNLAEYTNVSYYHANFKNLATLGIGTFNVLFADLGVSSLHFDIAERGFSFKKEGPLDLRLNRNEGMSAAQYLLEASEAEIVTMLYRYGEVRSAHKLAKKIKAKPPATTTQLATLIEEVYTFKAAGFYPKVFQALRIVINEELEALKQLLEFGTTIQPGGRIGIISFHSLEDRMVKQTFKHWCTPIKDEFTGQIATPAAFKLTEAKFVKPTKAEMATNPRSRSAILRVVQKVDSATIAV